jgi:autotransporter-associated beta strand protein
MLAIGNSLALGNGALTLNNGATFDLIESSGFFYSGSIFVPTGQVATLNSDALGGGFAGELSSGDTTSILNITGGVSFGATNSAQFDGFSGTINIQSGATLRFSANSSGNTYGSPNTTLIINGTLEPRNAGNTIQLGALSGSGILKGPQSNAGSGNTLYVIGGNNSSGTFSGLIQSNSAVAGGAVVIEKVGSGELTLSGNNTYAGGTTVAAGILSVDNTIGSGTGSGNLEIMDGATLCGTGIVGSATTMDDYSILAPGNPSGTLTFSNNLSLQNTSILLFGLGTNSSQVNVNGSLFLAGSLVVTNSGGFGVGSYTLFTCSPSNGLSFGSLALNSAPPAFIYSINTNTLGAVILIAAPTTPPVIGSITSSGSNLVMAGTNGVPLGSYVVLGSTNLALPLSNWTPILTNQFDGYGRFCVTNIAPTNNSQNFYILELPEPMPFTF